ncbi:MAG: hypothetical protein CMB97_14965 [Flavobacteriaceae bacterium]|nr:hypothetical protein [Flavobacteriaceae bacterium]|tara:strand:+ start:228 stop:1007 length:780 start_codon:yes stop_codon:yes gene_type:complete
MNCNEIEQRIFDYLERQLSEKEIHEFEKHLSQCEACRKELEETRRLTETIKVVSSEQPKTGHFTSFEDMLQREKQELKNHEPKVQVLYWKTAFQIAASILLLLGGYLYGDYRGKALAQKQIVQLQQQSQQLKTNMTLAMLDNRSASKRIQAVNYTEDIKMPDNQVLEAIIGRLQKDDNINVRLAAAGSLSRFQENQLVKDAFISTLETEENPEVQIAIIQFLVHVKDERSVKPMKKLLNQPEVPQYVKYQVNQGLAQIL